MHWTDPSRPGNRQYRPALLAAWLLTAVGAVCPATAQTGTGFDRSQQWRIERPGKDHIRLIGDVEAQRGEMTFHADVIDSFTDTHTVVATGHVVFTQGTNHISADRAEFNTETRLGTFFNANGSVVVADEPKKSMLGGQEPDVLFYGERVEKIGPKKYRITKGAFTTCVQPKPRWEMTSGTVVLNVDDYAFLRNAVLKAKGLPILYLPVLYYPINKEDRATGFLMPSYGTSTYQGFTLSNAFFWAISRSQDATFLHDWYTSRGQGMGLEYRYVGGGGARGDARLYRLNEHESTITDSSGVESPMPARKSYQVAGNLNQPLGRSWVARARVDYFSDITVQKTYHSDIYDASRSQRTVNGGVTGSLGRFTVSGNYGLNEYFSGENNTTVVGTAPQITVNRGDQPIAGTPIYFSLNGDYSNVKREYRTGETVTDSNLSRVDVAPVIRVPFTKLQWMTVNSSVTWRGTWWTRSRIAGTNELIDEGIARSYMQFAARIVGPVVNRVWNTPDNGYAEKFKHTVEPYVDIQRVTSVDNFDEIVQNDAVDSIIGGTTRINYGVNSRLLAKVRAGGRASPRDFVTLGISQTYYTDARASQYDYNYSTSYSGLPPSNFSPVSMVARFSPADRVNGSLRLEYDHEAHAVRSISANGQVASSDWLTVVAGYSHRRVRDYTSGAERAFRIDNSINASTTMRTSGNRLGGSYTIHYDIGRTQLLGSRTIGYYNAQCCGFAVEYQMMSFPQFDPSFPVKRDNRFNFSFTLAGLGTFSNFFGALGGGGTR